jgi:hypothetical protein
VQYFLAILPALVHVHPGQVVVIEAGPGQLAVLQIEAERLHQMQFRAGIGRQPDRVSGIGRYFRLVENDMKHLNTCVNRGNFRH